MIHALLVLAVILFVLWLLFHAAGGLVHLLWIGILIFLAVWAFRFLFGRGRAA